MKSKAAAVLLAAVLAVAGASAAQPATARTTVPSVLTAGHALTALTAHDQLRNGEFILTVEPTALALDQVVQVPGPRGADSLLTGVWFRDDPTGRIRSNTDRTRLYLSRAGNLSLRTSRGQLLWSTRTRAGAGSRLVLHHGGDLALYTAAGRRVWHSQTTRVLIPNGGRLASGERMTNRWDDAKHPPVWASVTMQRDGNLVLRCKGDVQWSSHTHVAGSYLAVQRNGNLVIRTPQGRAVWASHTHGSYVYLHELGLWSLASDRLLWAPPYSPPKGNGC